MKSWRSGSEVELLAALKSFANRQEIEAATDPGIISAGEGATNAAARPLNSSSSAAAEAAPDATIQAV
jgi:hypothetical protein